MAKSSKSIVSDPTKANLPLIDRPAKGKNKGKRAVADAVTPPPAPTVKAPPVAPTPKVTPAPVMVEVEGKSKSVKIPIRTTKIEAEIEELKASLLACDDAEEKKRIRRNLRAKGWFGGTRSRSGDAERGAAFDVVATNGTTSEPDEVEIEE